MHRPLGLLAVVLLAGCVGTLPGLDPGAGPPDPDADVKGWEQGVWHDESLRVDASDGLTERELERVVARSMARVELVRDVEFDARVPVELVTRERFRDRGGGSTPDPDKRAFHNAKMEALLLVGEDRDSLAVSRANRGASVAGYYSPGNEEIVVVTEGEAAGVDELTLAHELVHAWQDRRFDLRTLRTETLDGTNARNGLVEGDANLVEARYRRRCGGEWECVRPTDDGGGGGSLANFGVFALRFFPYSDGPPFVAALYDEGGWPAVNAAYRDLPASSEQVVDPARYGTDPPTTVALADRATGGWERVRPPSGPPYDTLGQAGLMAALVYPLYDSGGEAGVVPADAWLNRTADGDVSHVDPFNYDHHYAAGWDGDRLYIYRDGSGELGYVWRLVFDGEADAREFLEGYRRLLEYWGGRQVDERTWVLPTGPFADAFHVRRSGDAVTVTNAPTVPALAALRPGISVPDDPAVTPAPVTTPRPGTSTPTAEPVFTPGLGAGAALAALGALLAVALARRRAG